MRSFVLRSLAAPRVASFPHLSSSLAAARFCSSDQQQQQQQQRLHAKPLSAPDIGIPEDMSAEQSGTFRPERVQQLAQVSRLLRDAVDTAVPASSADELWQSQGQDALEAVARNSSYYDILRHIREHGYFFLIPRAIAAPDAPLPHVAYADIMQTLSTCTLQRPPEEQFQLPAPVLRLLLCTAARHILHDREYFPAVERWFRLQVERQQSLGSEAWSAWVMCCAAANRVDLALLFLQHMGGGSKSTQQQLHFDPVVFNYMLHPSEVMENERGVPESNMARILGIPKGFLQQQRVLREMQHASGVVAAGVHAMFVFYAITRQPVQQWETIRFAMQEQLKARRVSRTPQQTQDDVVGVSYVAPRTLSMITTVFEREKGRRCGPLTCRVLIQLFAEARDMFHCCQVLTVLRQREMEEELVPVKFTRQERQNVLRCFLPSPLEKLDQQHHQQLQQEQQDEAPATTITSFPSLASSSVDDDTRLHLPLLDRLLNADHTDPVKRNLPPLPPPPPSSSSAAPPTPSQQQQQPSQAPPLPPLDDSLVVHNEGSDIVAKRKSKKKTKKRSSKKRTNLKSSSSSRDADNDEALWRDLASPRRRDSSELPPRFVARSVGQMREDSKRESERLASGAADPSGSMLNFALQVEREKADTEKLVAAARDSWINPERESS